MAKPRFVGLWHAVLGAASGLVIIAACGDGEADPSTLEGPPCTTRPQPSVFSPVPTLPDVFVPPPPTSTSLPSGTTIGEDTILPYPFLRPNILTVRPPDETRVRAGDSGPRVPFGVDFVMPYGASNGPPEVSNVRLCLDGIDVTAVSYGPVGHETAKSYYYNEPLARGRHEGEVSYIDYTGTLVVYTWTFEVI